MPEIGGSLKFGWGVEIAGLKDLRKKLRAEQLLAGPWTEGMERIGQVAETAAIAGAPIGRTGQIINKMFHRVSHAQIPLLVTVGTKAMRKGYPYPRLLEWSPKHHHMSWLEKAIKRAWPAIERILEETGRRVQRQWDR